MSRRRSSRNWLGFARGGLAWLGLFAALLGCSHASELADTNRPFRLAFTSIMFTEVNENDARAAMKVWIMTVARERGLLVNPDPHIYRTTEELAQSCATNPLDGCCLITEDYATLSRQMKFDRLAVARNGGKLTEEYVVLVRQDSGWEKLDQLAGRSLNVLDTPSMSLALCWLDTLLLKAHRKRATEFFGCFTLVNKASRAALPVFFGKADICLMNKISFAVMGELNPQLSRQLRVLATSPELVPTCFAFRAENPSPLRPQMLEEMTLLGHSPAGQQILTVVQAQEVEAQPVSLLDRSLELLARHEQLCAATNAVKVSSEPVPQNPSERVAK